MSEVLLQGFESRVRVQVVKGLGSDEEGQEGVG